MNPARPIRFESAARESLLRIAGDAIKTRTARVASITADLQSLEHECAHEAMADNTGRTSQIRVEIFNLENDRTQTMVELQHYEKQKRALETADELEAAE